MSAVLERCALAGIRLRLEGPHLRYDAPKGAMTEALAADLKANKAEIMAGLTEQAALRALWHHATITAPGKEPMDFADTDGKTLADWRAYAFHQFGRGVEVMPHEDPSGTGLPGAAALPITDLTTADYDDSALSSADAAYQRKAAAEPGYEPAAQARYCSECANRAADKRCLAWERIGAPEGWKPADRAPRRCRGFEPTGTTAVLAIPPLSPAAEARRQKVLAILARDGGQYATLVEDPNTDPVVMALATSDGTREVLIPRDRYDPFAVLELVKGWEREGPEHDPLSGSIVITEAEIEASRKGRIVVRQGDFTGAQEVKP